MPAVSRFAAVYCSFLVDGEGTDISIVHTFIPHTQLELFMYKLPSTSSTIRRKLVFLPIICFFSKHFYSEEEIRVPLQDDTNYIERAIVGVIYESIL